MKIAQHIPAWLRNKYVLTAIGFIVWISFFDDRDLITHFKRQHELKQLEESRDYYQEQISTVRKELNQLQNNPKALEKYAREKYRMKKDNEDLYITPE